MKAEIDAGGRRVVIECADANVTYRQVMQTVHEVWVKTAAGPGPGFTLAVPRAEQDTDAT